MASSYMSFELSYEGGSSDDHEIDFYDVSQALIGFQRSLAITTHLILNDKVITQAPSLTGAQIFVGTPEEGSWKITAVVVAGLFSVGTAEKETPIGHLMHSAYDYVISESLGFHVDYNQSLGQQYEALKAKGENRVPILDQTRFDSAIEKSEVAIENIHRPIVFSQTAQTASITAISGRTRSPLQPTLNPDTYQYVRYTEPSARPKTLVGRVSSYNINTYKGRMFVEDFNRPIPFTLSESARGLSDVRLITESLSSNARDRFAGVGNISFEAFLNHSRSQRLKSLGIVTINGEASPT